MPRGSRVAAIVRSARNSVAQNTFEAQNCNNKVLKIIEFDTNVRHVRTPDPDAGMIEPFGCRVVQWGQATETVAVWPECALLALASGS